MCRAPVAHGASARLLSEALTQGPCRTLCGLRCTEPARARAGRQGFAARRTARSPSARGGNECKRHSLVRLWEECRVLAFPCMRFNVNLWVKSRRAARAPSSPGAKNRYMKLDCSRTQLRSSRRHATASFTNLCSPFLELSPHVRGAAKNRSRRSHVVCTRSLQSATSAQQSRKSSCKSWAGCSSLTGWPCPLHVLPV